MMYEQQPWYHNYPPNVSYNPYLHSSHQRSSPFDPVPARGYPYDLSADERQRALAEHRARRAKWLPDEVDEDEDDDWSSGNYAQSEPSYWEAKRKLQEERAREQREEALRRQADQRRQQILLQKQREEEQAKQQMWAEMRQQTLKREEEARQRAAEQVKIIPGRQDRARSKSHSRMRQEDQSKEAMAESSEPLATQPQTHPESTFQTQKPQPSIEEQEKAARRIQQQYRTHSAGLKLDQVVSDFEKLKNNFVYPRTIDFQKSATPGEHVSVAANRPPSDFNKEPEEGEDTPMAVDGEEGKLAYTSINYPLHSYVDALDKLLMRLDGVESAGNKAIRAKRRAIVKDVEKEASKLERYWKQAWADHLTNDSVQQSDEHATDAPAAIASEPAMDPICPNFG